MPISTVISATDIQKGDTVYLTSCDAWTRDIAVAELLGPDDVDWRMAFANRLREVKNAVAIDATADKNGLAQRVAA